jgi:hypothetical protein
MNRLLVATAALVMAGTASAQTTSGSTGSTNAPNPGAGVQGMPGSKSGPAVRSGSSTSNQQTGSAGQDASKIQGMPGNKSGPAAKSPSPKE